MEDVVLQLIGIRKEGKGVGSDLAFTINTIQFREKVTKKGVEVHKEIGRGRCPRNLRYAVRVKIHVVESDPVYDDSATSYQTILVPTGTSGDLTTKMRLYEHRKKGKTDKFITIYFDFKWRRGNQRQILFEGEENLLEDDSGNHPIPAPQLIPPCREEHRVSIVSTLWIAPMDVDKEVAAFMNNWFKSSNTGEQKYLNKHTTKEKAKSAFKIFAQRTNLFFNDTGDPSEVDSCRIANVFLADITVEDGLITSFDEREFISKGGKEIAGFEGSAHAKIVKLVRTEVSVLVRYIVYGKPSVYLEPGFVLTYPRTSTYIWHYIEVLITPNPDCSINTKARFLTSSAFPSHRLWLNGKELPPANNNEFNNNQFDLIALWNSASKDSEPLDKLPELREFFSKKTWPLFVAPRSSSGDVLPWP